jgi:outer membrane immunogenic protein
MPTPSWAGFYAGLDLGWLGNKASFNEATPGWNGLDASTTVSGVIGGGHFGYNWQVQQFVYGLEADIGGASGSRTASDTFPGAGSLTSSINWLSTFRGRLGIDYDNWLVYGTAGWAVAAVHNVRVDTTGPFTLDQTKTMNGFVWGAGVERMFAPNWSGRLEVLATDLGHDDVTTIAPNGTYITHFTNKMVVVRGGVSFKW